MQSNPTDVMGGAVNTLNWEVMTPSEFEAVLMSVTPEQLKTLDFSDQRYIGLIGVLDVDVPLEVLEADKIAYSHIISKKSESGDIVLSDDDFLMFMSAVSGLSHDICSAWQAKAYYTMHGETAAVMAAMEQAPPTPCDFWEHCFHCNDSGEIWGRSCGACGNVGEDSQSQKHGPEFAARATDLHVEPIFERIDLMAFKARQEIHLLCSQTLQRIDSITLSLNT
ncbi:hypothetical protein [Pseudomonas sp. MWU12-2323]|uniref:hypothetical protein n=1 Tax=Pseudomonas sp. MWU12-2323 TaxID=2651296 RepID=UPI00128C6E29|nr:hypothetical protein [Pseudomonas sp. MWU12-2323]MPQ71537.1 hypothetical protein [Pseudomonas sp. MWU12-2323]